MRHLSTTLLPIAAVALSGCLFICSTSQSIASPSTPLSLQDEYIALADSADNFMAKSNWSEAERVIVKALKLQPANPSNALLFSNLGLCQSHRSKYDDALQSFELALIKAPGSPKVLFNRARTYLAMGNYDDGLSDLNEVLVADSLNTDALRLRGTILLSKQRPDDAYTDFTRLNSILSDDPITLSGMAQCLDLLGKTNDATRLFLRVMSLTNDSELLQTAILHFLSHSDLNRADDILRQALKFSPRDGMLYLYRALLHRMRFQNEEAEIDKKIAKEYGVDSQIIENTLRNF